MFYNSLNFFFLCQKYGQPKFSNCVIACKYIGVYILYIGSVVVMCVWVVWCNVLVEYGGGEGGLGYVCCWSVAVVFERVQGRQFAHIRTRCLRSSFPNKCTHTHTLTHSRKTHLTHSHSYAWLCAKSCMLKSHLLCRCTWKCVCVVWLWFFLQVKINGCWM